MKPALLLAVLILPAISAEVVDKSAAGFLVKNSATIAAPPAQVYAALVEKVGSWWDPMHTWSGKAENLSIAAKAGGCFCEALPRQGSVQHMTVVYAAPGEILRMVGALGPLQESGVTGTLTMALTKSDAGTLITMTYSAGGYYQGGLQALAAPVDQVLGAQLARLKNFVERGSPRSN